MDNNTKEEIQDIKRINSGIIFEKIIRIMMTAAYVIGIASTVFVYMRYLLMGGYSETSGYIHYSPLDEYWYIILLLWILSVVFLVLLCLCYVRERAGAK